MNLNNRLRSELKSEENEKKSISIMLPSTKVNELDQIIMAFAQVNREKTFTRQGLIEIAIDDLIEESKKILKENGVDDIYKLQEYESEENKEFDTVIFPAQLEGFNRAFLTERKWYYVRLGKEKIDGIRYVACYIGAPISAITHYAEVDSIEPAMIEGKQKYILKFKGEAIKLENPVPIGKVSSMTVRANRYVTLESLKSAKSYKDLL